jgi:RNA-directed DNA polymerase
VLLQKLKEVFRRYQSQPIGRVIEEINPVLRGWVNYFRIGHAGRCFSFVQDWVERKIRRHMMQARNRPGFGWKRWSRVWIYKSLNGAQRRALWRTRLGPSRGREPRVNAGKNGRARRELKILVSAVQSRPCPPFFPHS